MVSFFFLFVCLLLVRVPWTPGWPWALYLVKGDFGLLIFLSLDSPVIGITCLCYQAQLPSPPYQLPAPPYPVPCATMPSPWATTTSCLYHHAQLLVLAHKALTDFLMEVHKGILPRLVDHLIQEEQLNPFHYITLEFSLFMSTSYLHSLKPY